ncbi:hypothetical protein HDU97_004590 [Phlyctochytrium planicorne]|nr:hypothetical protein HDU97_004590 [Phlyctochytrium planicorne]
MGSYKDKKDGFPIAARVPKKTSVVSYFTASRIRIIFCVLAVGLVYYFFVYGSAHSGFEARIPLIKDVINIKQPTSATSTKAQIGDPLFEPPNSPFYKAIKALKNSTVHQKRSRHEKFAVALKTGAEVAVERASIQLVTFLSTIKNLVIIGETSGVHIGEHPMIDVYNGVYDLVDRRLAAMGLDDDKKKKGKGGPADEKFKVANDAKAGKNKDRILERRSKEEAVVPAEESKGWKLDAHKNLPGFEYLYKTHPDADWYIMIDDDSYVFFDNLDRYLHGKDPSKPFYIGQSNVFLGCDGVVNFGEGPFFAHGGSGIVVSRGAMKKMMGSIEKCIKKYRDSGDVRVALCLRDVDILLSPGTGFEKEPPNDSFKFPSNGCTRPNVFHHLLPHQIQRLFEIEMLALAQHPDKGVTMADILHGFNRDRIEAEADTDRTGNDFENKPSSTFQMCEGLCYGNKKCVAWAFDGSTCWMKDKLSRKSEVKGVMSGIIAERYKC